MKKYLARLFMSLQKQVTYRARVLIYILMDCSLFFIFPFLWLSVFQDRVLVGGYTKESIVTYYVVAGFVTLLSSSHSAGAIHQDIRGGKLSSHLLRPINYFLWHFFAEGGYRIVSLCVAIPLFVLLSQIFPEYIFIPEHLSTFVFFFFSVFFAWILSAIFQYIVGMSAFWLGESGFAFQVRWFLEKVFSGEIAPITLMPLFIQKIAFVLPFQYLFFFPIQIYLETLSFEEIRFHFAIFGAWILFGIWLVRWMFRRGVKQYDGGGI